MVQYTRRNSLKEKQLDSYYFMKYLRVKLRYTTFTTFAPFILLICFLIASIVYMTFNPEFQEPGIEDLKPDQFSERLRDIDDIMVERRRHLIRTCHKHKLDVAATFGTDQLRTLKAREFIIDYKHRLVWCPVFKAAASSWMHNFNLLAGYSEDYLDQTTSIPMELARRKYPPPTLKELNEAIENSVSFLIVRDPFERLLSAYRDRFLRAKPQSDFAKLGLIIIRMYRKGASKNYNENRPTHPTFPEFVKYLSYVHKHKLELNIHWTPVTIFCTPCLVHFDLILKFETLLEDQQFLIHQTDIGDTVRPVHLNAGEGDTKGLIKEYYSQLTKQQLDEIHEMFKYDFEIFNYTTENYYNFVKT